jgi:MFS family permease
MSLLRNRGFALLWAGQFLGMLADWSLRTMVLIWVYGLTHSGVAVSLVGLAEAFPLVAFAPVAGVFVDRWSRARTMAISVLARATLLLPLLAVTGRAGFPIILAVVFCANAASQFYMPAASAAVPVVVGQERVGQANSLLSPVQGVIAVVGPAAAALLYAAVGPRGTLLSLLGLYLVAAPILSLVPAPRPAVPAAGRASVVSEIRDGLGYVTRSRLLLALTAVAFVALLGVGALSVLDVVFVTRALHLRSETVGVLFTASGAGQIVGGILVAMVSRWVAQRYHLLLGLAMLINGLVLVGYALAPSLLVASGMLFASGLSFAPLIVAFMTLIQLATDDAYMGRVMSLVNTGMAVAMIVSMTAGGALTDLFGVRQVIGGGALMLIVAGLLSLAIVRATPAPPGAQVRPPETALIPEVAGAGA